MKASESSVIILIQGSTVEFDKKSLILISMLKQFSEISFNIFANKVVVKGG